MGFLHKPIRFPQAFAFSTLLFLLPAHPPITPTPTRAAQSSSEPQIPCAADNVYTYPASNQPPAVKSWKLSELGDNWKAPACTGWSEPGFTTLVTTAARFPYSADVDSLLLHIGAVSQRAGIRYWSTTHQRWQTLIVDAHGLSGAKSPPRGDFTPAEMKAGRPLYFEQVDNLTGKAIYKMQILEASAHRIVFEIENVSTIRYAFLPVLHPGEIQSIYFLDRESDGVWRFFSVVRTGRNANRRLVGNESSAINRAIAFYRWFVGVPTDQEPPAAR